MDMIVDHDSTLPSVCSLPAVDVNSSNLIKSVKLALATTTVIWDNQREA